MADDAQTLKLATIVALDVAGYSARTEADETKTAAEITALRKVIEGIAARHGGRVFNTAGDGFMLDFGSSLSAVEAAFELAETCEPKVRFGVHLGDVVVQPNGDLLGHGVNVAARLMAQSSPGAALVSAAVRQTIRGPIADRLQSRGMLKLDKVAETIEAFALTVAALATGATPLKDADAASVKAGSRRKAVSRSTPRFRSRRYSFRTRGWGPACGSIGVFRSGGRTMQKTLSCLLWLVASAMVLVGCAPEPTSSAQALALAANDPALKWGPCPPIFPAGCEIAVLQGDPAKPNADVFLRVPAKYEIPAHAHASAERMILVTGQLQLTYKGQAPATLDVGTYAYGPAKLAHKASCLSEDPCTLFIAFELPVDAQPHDGSLE